MNLYVKQKVFSWGDKFAVYDEQGNERFYVWGEVFTLGKKLHVENLMGEEVAFIHQKPFSFKLRYFVNRNGQDVAEVVKEITFFRQAYTVNGFGWEIHGDFMAHEYEILQNGNPIISVSKQWFTWGDAYEINILPGIDEVNALSVVLIIDACLAASNNS